MNKIGEVFLIVCLSTSSAYAGQGSAEGNSSDAWVCRDSLGNIDPSEPPILRDLEWAADELGLQPDFKDEDGQSVTGIVPIARLMLERLSVHSPRRAERYEPMVLELAQVMENYTDSINAGETPQLRYENVLFSDRPLSRKAQPNDCGWERFIRYIHEIEISGMKRFKINTEVFDLLSDRQKGVAAFHEIVNQEAVTEERRRNEESRQSVENANDHANLPLTSIANSYKVWSFVARIASNNVHNILDFSRALAEVQFREFELDNALIDPATVRLRESGFIEARLTESEYIPTNPDSRLNLYSGGEKVVFDTDLEIALEETELANEATFSFSAGNWAEPHRVIVKAIDNETGQTVAYRQLVFTKKGSRYSPEAKKFHFGLPRGHYTLELKAVGTKDEGKGQWRLLFLESETSKTGTMLIGSISDRQSYEFDDDEARVHRYNMEVRSSVGKRATVEVLSKETIDY